MHGRLCEVSYMYLSLALNTFCCPATDDQVNLYWWKQSSAQTAQSNVYCPMHNAQRPAAQATKPVYVLSPALYSSLISCQWMQTSCYKVVVQSVKQQQVVVLLVLGWVAWAGPIRGKGLGVEEYQGVVF